MQRPAPLVEWGQGPPCGVIHFGTRIRRNCIGPGLVGYFVGSSHISLQCHTAHATEFDAVKAFGEHVGVVVLTADMTDT
jgi:hypothetical protein